jgi:hypothetical protein
MAMQLDWSVHTVGEWREWLGRAPRSNCMQSWPYAKAVRMSDQKASRLGLIRRDGRAVGLMAIQEVKLGPIHFINLFRGPLWFVENPPSEWLSEFAACLDHEFPKRFLRRRRWLPEWETGQASVLSNLNPFTPRGETYATAWIDLRLSEEKLRANFQQKWRNSLNKAERSGFEVVVDEKGTGLNLFVECYIRDKWSKKYHGPSGRFVKEEFEAARPFGEAFLLWAAHEGRRVAGVFVLVHGTSATYRVGWSLPEGRKLNAHNLLLWRALQICKNRGLHFFDVGGIPTEGDESLNRFKLGMGAKPSHSPGMFS